MADYLPNAMHMLLVEPVTLLRRTVALTARSMGMALVHEAASEALAVNLLKRQRFDGAVIAIDQASREAELATLALLDRVRGGNSASPPTIPIAVMLEQCDEPMLLALRERGVTRVLLKPFKARNLLDTFTHFATLAALPARAQDKALFGIHTER